MWNNHLTVHDMPDDVLSHIFAELAQVDLPGFFHETLNPNNTITTIYHWTLGWIAVSHVCQRWRTLLLSLSSLWAAVVCKLPLAFETILERARSAPLTMHIIPHYSASLEWLERVNEVALERIENIRVLHCFLRDGPQLYRARDVLSRHTLPLLIEINVLHSVGEVEHVTPEDALDLDAPNLTIASLDSLRCNFTSMYLRTLSFSHRSGAVDSTGHFLRILRNAPLLEVLSFSIDCSPVNQARSISNTGEEVVHLAHLKRICARRIETIDTAVPDASLFFRHVSIPKTCIFHYHDSTHGPHIGWEGPLETCSDRLHQLPYDAMSIHISAGEEEDVIWLGAFFVHECPFPLDQQSVPHSVHHCCSASRGLHPHWPSASGIRLKITGADDELWRAQDILPAIGRKIRCQFITHLYLDGIDDRAADDLAALISLLRLFSALTTLFIRSNFKVLGTLLNPAMEHDQPLLPALRDIVIDQTSCLRGNWGETLGSWWEGLIYALKQREQAGNPIRTVRLSGAWMDDPKLAFNKSSDEKFIERARRHVSQLHDERVWPSSSNDSDV